KETTGKYSWETASSSTYKNGEIEITATIDGRVKSVTEASIRRHLKLEDSKGISNLPNIEIFEQLALMVTTAGAKINTASPKDKTAETSNDSDDTTLAETLIEIRRSAKKPQKAKGVSFRDVEETPRLIRSTITLQPLLSIDPKHKGKGVLVEEEPVKEELAEVDRAQKERQKQEEATIAILTKEFDEIQVRIDADHELAARLTYEEQEQFTI
nr:hypothetical protein [Tanacetum cinerariifolium]